MNEIAKKCIQERLIAAIEKEGLKTSEAAKILDISPTYVSLIKNSDHWHKCTKAAWEAVQKWTNSGLSLKEYGRDRPLPNYDKVIQTCPSQDDLINAVKEAIITEDQKVSLVEYVDGILKENTEGRPEPTENTPLIEPEDEYKKECDKVNSEIRRKLGIDIIPCAPVNEPIRVSIEIDITLSINGKKINLNT